MCSLAGYDRQNFGVTRRPKLLASTIPRQNSIITARGYHRYHRQLVLVVRSTRVCERPIPSTSAFLFWGRNIDRFLEHETDHSPLKTRSLIESVSLWERMEGVGPASTFHT